MYHEIEFTQSAITNAVRIGGKDTFYQVLNHKHLHIRVYENKTTLAVQHTFEGKRLNKRVGTFPMMKLTTFKQLADELVEKMESGGNYSLGLRVTLDDYFHQVYLPDAKKNKRSWSDDESRYRLYISPKIGQIKLAKIKPYHVRNLLSSLPEHLSNRSHDLILALMSVTFNKAIFHEVIDKSPCRTSKPIGSCNVIERYMDEPEYTAFINACLFEADVTSDRFTLQSICLLFALFTGVRIGNCISLTRSMLSKCKTAIYLPATHTKTKKPQTIYLSTFAQTIVQRALSVSDDEHIFPSEIGSTGHISKPNSSFRRICKRAGIACAGSDHTINSNFPTETLSIHCLRKTLATVVRNNYSTGVVLDEESIKAACALLGHSNSNVTTTHYAFSNGNLEKHAAEVASQTLLKSISN